MIELSGFAQPEVPACHCFHSDLVLRTVDWWTSSIDILMKDYAPHLKDMNYMKVSV